MSYLPGYTWLLDGDKLSIGFHKRREGNAWTVPEVPVIMARIPDPQEDGSCDDGCAFNYDLGNGCTLNLAVEHQNLCLWCPGPECPAHKE